MDVHVDTTTRIETDAKGQLTLGVASQLGDSNAWAWSDFLGDLARLKCKNLILMGPLPHPKVWGMNTLWLEHDGLVELVHGGTGAIAKLIMVYDPALAVSGQRRRRITALSLPYIEDPIPPIVLIGGTRVGSNRRAGVVEHIGGAWVVQVGVFNPLEGLENITRVENMGHRLDPSYGGTRCHVDLDDRNCPITPTFRDYSWACPELAG